MIAENLLLYGRVAMESGKSPAPGRRVSTDEPGLTGSASGISAEERDALHDLLLDKLSGIDDLGHAITRKDYRKVEHLGHVYHDYLTLLLLDLGWNERGYAVDSFSTPGDVLRRVFARVREAAEGPQAFLEKDRADADELESRNQRLLAVCMRVLGTSSEPAASGGQLGKRKGGG